MSEGINMIIDILAWLVSDFKAIGAGCSAGTIEPNTRSRTCLEDKRGEKEISR
jgi:hypothetical protein